QQAIIIEVSQNPHHIKDKIMSDFAAIEVIAIFDTLFQGLALKVNPEQLKKLSRANFVKGFYPAQTYEATIPLSFTKYGLNTTTLFEKKTDNYPIVIKNRQLTTNERDESVIFPQELNDTNYTGKGIK